jgi:hypothetical protein
MIRRIWQLTLAGMLVCLLLLGPLAQSLHAAVPDRSIPALLPTQSVTGTEKGAELVKVGLYITRLDNFDLVKKSFDATFWLWSLAPNSVDNRLDAIEFANAEDIRFSNDYSKKTPAGVWSQRKVVGSFHHDWDLRNFPFDHQDLVIKVEESEAYISALVYVPDQPKTVMDADLKIKGWRVVSSQLRAGSKTYMSSFGDPALPPGSPTTFSNFDVTVRLVRTNFTAFWKFTAGAWVAAAIALASYAFHVDKGQTMSPRFALLSGAVFAAIISLRTESTELGTISYNTLVDQIHLVTLLYVIVATFAGVYTWSLYRRHEDSRSIQRLGRSVAFVSTLVMVVMIVSLVRKAMIA